MKSKVSAALPNGPWRAVRGDVMTTTEPIATYRGPIWPLLVAPLAAGVYYLMIKDAFVGSILDALGESSTILVDPTDVNSAHWGSHWIYRSIAELISTGAATFVAAGLAHGRERAAGIIGGATISLGYVAVVGLLGHVWLYERDQFSFTEPWYQYAIHALMVFAAPIIGYHVAEAAEDMHRETPTGFGGIGRGHLLWLWLPAFWYARGLIGPLARIYGLDDEAGDLVRLVVFIVNIIPAAAIAVPGYYGLSLLAGVRGAHLRPVLRNLFGVLVLIAGFATALFLQLGWYWLMHFARQAIFK